MGIDRLETGNCQNGRAENRREDRLINKPVPGGPTMEFGRPAPCQHQQASAPVEWDARHSSHSSSQPAGYLIFNKGEAVRVEEVLRYDEQHAFMDDD